MRHSHGYAALLDSSLRTMWYGQGKFPLSAALQASAKRKLRDSSSGSVKGSGHQTQLFSI